MESIQIQCSRCNATMVPTSHGGYTTLSCPFCGSTSLLSESDRIKAAQLHAATKLTSMAYDYQKHQDYLGYAYANRRAQAICICVFAAIALIFLCFYLFQ